MSEWLKEHAWKACVGETLPRVRIPLSPPFFCGRNFIICGCGCFQGRTTVAIGSCAIGIHEPRQVRKEATVSGPSYVPQERLVAAVVRPCKQNNFKQSKATQCGCFFRYIYPKEANLWPMLPCTAAGVRKILTA